MNTMSASDQTLPRKITAVGTMGEMGQLFTVYEKNWYCKDCGQENYASRPRCFRCKKQKPEGENNYVMDPALEAARANKTIIWQEVIDPTSYQIYYYNKETGATQWERPPELGPAPVATGWFGRGVAGSNAALKYKQLNDYYLSRPARKQKDFIDPKKYHLEGANEYNIWYGRYIGDYEKGMKQQEAAVDRCILDTDAGSTRADQKVTTMKSSGKESRYFCIHFAHGVCAKGSECHFYHRVPLPEDDAKCDELMDCFGRTRHAAHRDDMDGTGSFMKPCRTLFVGNLLKHKYTTPKDLEDALWKHFGEWGELESVNVIMRLSIAFPRYRLRTSAEFAKEAMNGQSLDQNEILSIRWAYDDPNPVAQDAISRADRDALSALLTAKGISTQSAPFEYPTDYTVPDTKRMRLDNGLNISQEHPDIAYPNTDQQYQYTSTNNTMGIQSVDKPMRQVEYDLYCQQYYYQILSGTVSVPTTTTTTTTSSSSSSHISNTLTTAPNNESQDTENKPVLSSFLSDLLKPINNITSATSDVNSTNNTSGNTEANNNINDIETSTSTYDIPSGWEEHIDDDSGATYYYNVSTGESTWELPSQ